MRSGRLRSQMAGPKTGRTSGPSAGCWCTSLISRLPARPTPALLHGDLWGGNILVAGDRVSGLIDPACYHGHTEVDLAMLGLFDQPDAAFYEAYGCWSPAMTSGQRSIVSGA